MSEKPLNHSSTGTGRQALPSNYFAPVPVYVPTKPWLGRPFGILPGSAIVGVPRLDDATDSIEVYFEGNLYGDEYFFRFAMRCLHAHGRMAQRYPTVAKARVLLRNLVEVGIWHPRQKVVEVTDMVLLADWCSWKLPINTSELTAQE